ncbi:MAG: hypothetical protein PBV01_20995 [Brucella anthropi]
MRAINFCAAILIVSATSASAVEYCYSPPGTKAFLQQTVGQWRILKSKCSCSAIAFGKPTSMFAIHANKPSTEHVAPTAFLILATDKEYAGDPNKYRVYLDGFEVEAEIGYEQSSNTLFASPKMDIYEAVSASHSLSFGPYTLPLKQSRKAMSALMACYSKLSGQ